MLHCTMNPLYNDIRYNSLFRYNVNLACTKICESCIFIPRPKGSGDIAMSLASVRTSVRNILMILHSYLEQAKMMCRVQKMRALPLLFLSYLPSDAFLCIFVSAL